MVADSVDSDATLPRMKNSVVCVDNLGKLTSTHAPATGIDHTIQCRDLLSNLLRVVKITVDKPGEYRLLTAVDNLYQARSRHPRAKLTKLAGNCSVHSSCLVSGVYPVQVIERVIYTSPALPVINLLSHRLLEIEQELLLNTVVLKKAVQVPSLEPISGSKTSLTTTEENVGGVLNTFSDTGKYRVANCCAFLDMAESLLEHGLSVL